MRRNIYVLLVLSLVFAMSAIADTDYSTMTLEELSEAHDVAEMSGDPQIFNDIVLAGINNFPFGEPFVTYNFVLKVRNGDSAGATEIADKMLLEDPDNGDWLIKKGIVCFELESDVANAEKYFDQAIAGGMSTPELWLYKAIAVKEAKDYDTKTVMEYLDKGYALIPDAPENDAFKLAYLFEMAPLYIETGDEKTAIDKLVAAVEIEPGTSNYIVSVPEFQPLLENETLKAKLESSQVDTVNANITIPVGQPAPDFELTDVNGAKYKLSDFQDKIVLLNIWATWCPPCRDEIPDIIKIQEEFGGDDFIVLSICTDSEDAKAVTEFVESMDINYPVLLDDGVVASSYISTGGGIPQTYFIDKSGNVADFIYGGASKPTFEAAINKLLK